METFKDGDYVSKLEDEKLLNINNNKEMNKSTEIILSKNKATEIIKSLLFKNSDNSINSDKSKNSNRYLNAFNVKDSFIEINKNVVSYENENLITESQKSSGEIENSPRVKKAINFNEEIIIPKLNLKNIENYEEKLKIDYERPKIINSRVLNFVSNGTIKQISEIIKQSNNDSEDLEYPLKICIICDQFFLEDKCFSAQDCSHTFCKRCGKCFVEEKIESGDNPFKCPIYKCFQAISEEIIKNLVSEKHFLLAQSKKLDKLTNNSTGIAKLNSVKLYSQKHVIDINTNESFYIYNKAKEQFCLNCSEPALYGKTGKYVIKCLNCYISTCKFCMKAISKDHFEISSNNYCRVYFRKRNYYGITNEKAKSGCKFFWFQILIFIVSFILISLCLFNYVAKIFSYALCLKNKNTLLPLRLIMFYIVIIAIYIVLTPILLMSISYLPLLINLFG